MHRGISIKSQTAIYKILIIGVIFLLSFETGVSAKKDGTIDTFTVNKDDGNVIINASILFDEGFNRDITHAIQSGVETTFIYKIELKKDRLMWFDKRLLRLLVKKVIKYDTLKKEYNCIERQVGNKKEVIKETSHIFNDISKATEWLSHLNEISLDTKRHVLMNLKGKYNIRVKAEIKPIKFWFPFNYILFFIPTSEFNTPWKTMKVNL